jgi:hypothetical protein
VTFHRLAAIAVVFLGTSLAWAVLGSSLVARSGEFDGRLEREVQLLWGRPHRQIAPTAWVQRPAVDTEVEETKDQQGRVLRKQVSKTVLRSVPIALESTRATVDLDLEHRRKGLLWYATYTVIFKGTFYRRCDPHALRPDADDGARLMGRNVQSAYPGTPSVKRASLNSSSADCTNPRMGGRRSVNAADGRT